jgi:DNA-binding NarL/FixJ family response regulator
VILVDGEPGIGKSWLLRDATDEAAELGFSLATGAADQLAQAIPFCPLRTALREPFAEGLNNGQVAARMYISTHTVAHHLRQAFRKLSIASRVELTRVVIEQATAARELSPGPDTTGALLP